ncbi:MAG: undecaprenyldiphospho-muramoylpentapeptide beta-N-acetylglucosaminyltransferase [Firmicutes bacterium]|nr:undecaprenyldiphospho-muramoylpentapeptide beta-N-acetylglucosaminyltransferase [Bacillota bacterium]
MLKAIVCGGGTGGHIYPALAIAEQLRADGARVLYMGAGDSTEQKLAADAGFAFRGVECCGLHKRSPRLIADLLRNYRGSRQARRIISEYGPKIVIGTGGYAEAPVIKAAQGLGIPTVLHEQNAYPGLANRRLSRKAQAVCLTFAAAAPYFPHADRLHETGLPVRRQVLEADREAAWEYFDIGPEEQGIPTLLITGGSLGAASLNRAAAEAYPALLAAGVRVIHLCGRKNYREMKAAAPQHPRLILLPYLDEMQHALALADLAVGRAGASFSAEALCLGLPTVLIPYPYAANDHQRFNARAMAEGGASVVIEDDALNGDVLTRTVLELLNDPERLQAMGESAKAMARYDAARDIAAVAYGLI